MGKRIEETSPKRIYRWQINTLKSVQLAGFPGGAVVKNQPASAGDTGWSPGP